MKLDRRIRVQGGSGLVDPAVSSTHHHASQIRGHLLPVSVLVKVVALQPYDDEGHDGLDDAELQRGLQFN